MPLYCVHPEWKLKWSTGCYLNGCWQGLHVSECVLLAGDLNISLSQSALLSFLMHSKGRII